MARVIGAINRDTNYEVTVRKPIDARSLVKTYDDLLNNGSWLYSGKSIAYNGMIVAVWGNTADPSKNGVYFLHDPAVTSALKAPDVTNADNWHKLSDTEYDDTAIAKRIEAIEKDYLKAEDKYDDSDLANRVKTVETVVGNAEQGLIKDIAINTKAIADLDVAYKTADEKALTSAKTYTDEEIAGLKVTIEQVDSIEYIVIKDKDGNEISSVNAAKFVQDSFLNNVEYNTETGKVIFTWLMGDGSNKTDEIDIAHLVDTYTAGNGLTVENNQFSIDTNVVATKEDLDKVKVIAEAAQTADEVASAISDKIAEANLSQYANKVEVETALASKVDADKYSTDRETFAIKSEVADIYATKKDIEGIASENYVDSKFAEIKIPNNVSEFINDAGYLTAIPESYITKEYSKAFYNSVKYEVVPHEGMIVDYRGSEIRINTQRVKPTAQQAGPTATPNQYYVQFKAYAPENAISYKEWQGDKRDETIHTFDESFSGTDKFGRHYSLIWMSIASFSNGAWSLYGDRSTTEKYLGFYYTFEWYDENGALIDTSKVRIILTNDACHNDLVPDAITKKIDEKISKIDLTPFVTKETFEDHTTAASTNMTALTNELAAANDKIAAMIQPKESSELSVAADGTIGIKEISLDKLTQTAGNILVLNGGNALN